LELKALSIIFIPLISRGIVSVGQAMTRLTRDRAFAISHRLGPFCQRFLVNRHVLLWTHPDRVVTLLYDYHTFEMTC
jgi:hypothetical protein